MKLYGVTTTYNDEKIVPYVMPYLELLGYDKLVVYDNESTDGTVEMIKKYPFVEVRTYSSGGKFDEYLKTKIKADCIAEFAFNKRSEYIGKDEIAWVTGCDFDEVLYFIQQEGLRANDRQYGLNFKEYLNHMTLLGYNVCNEDIVDIVSENFPNSDSGLIHKNAEMCSYGRPYLFNKPNLFRIDNISEYYISLGSHKGWFRFNGQEIKCFNNSRYLFSFHLKYIDREYFSNRNKIYAERGYAEYADNEYMSNKAFDEKLENSFSIREYIKNRQLNGLLHESWRISAVPL